MDNISFDVRDEYQRKPIAEKIIRLLESDTNVSPLVIDGNWGSGKTEFCKKLIRLIEDDAHNIKPIYVDAFKADHADEPLLTLMAAVLKALPEPKREPLTKKAIPVIKFGIKTGLKAGVSWLLKQDTADLAEDFEADLKQAGDEVVNHAVESLLADHVSVEEGIATLQKALGELATEKPIAIFIDELDRCRPDFSVNMLENIKHIFEVEGVQFVLIANFVQLRTSINHCYGNALDAQKYLDRFVSFRFNLSETYKPDGHNVVLASRTHLFNLISNSQLLQNSCLISESSSELLDELVRSNSLSLREVEAFIRNLEIYQILTEGDGLNPRLYIGYSLLRIFGVYIFCFKPNVAMSINRGEIDAGDIAEILDRENYFCNFDGQRISESEILLAMISSERIQNCDRYFPKDEETRNRWNRLFSEIFGGRMSRREGMFQHAINEIIETLKLSR